MFPNRTIKILLIEDETFDERRIRNTIKPFEKYIVIGDVTSGGGHALELLKKNKNRYDVVIMDFQIADNIRGENLIRRIKEIDRTLQIIVLTKMTVNITDFDFANRLLEAGAMWYCTKYPNDIEDYIYQPTDFILSIINAYEKSLLKKEKQKSNLKLTQNVNDILQKKCIIGESEAIKNLRMQIQQCAQSGTTVLIRGASGTGKELAAANIHYTSSRRLEKFVPINCGSLPGELVESELFGFERGAFTGAQEKKLGLFEVADNGTVFLDEISELPLSAQVKLLRVIQEGEIDKIGRTERVKVNVRIIAATNRNLEEAVRENRFREDLYYRVNVVSIWMHPLNTLRKDIPILIDHFMQKFSDKMGQEVPVITEEGMQILLDYHWPGNVRELQNVVQRLLFSRQKELTEFHTKTALGLQFQTALDDHSLDMAIWNPDNILSWRETERMFRETYFRFVRKHTASDAEAARKLGLAPPNYHRMCKELGLK